MASSIAAFAWACLVIELTPGPNMTYLAVLTLAEGRKAGFAAVAGVAAGLAVAGLLAAVGVGALVSSSPFLYQTLRIAGVGYLLWLAYETWFGEANSATHGSAVAAATHESVGLVRAFRNGFVTNLLNPKAALFYLAVLPVFLDPGRPSTGQALVLSAIYVSIATAVHVAVVAAAARARPMIEAGGQSAVVRAILSLMLAVVAIWMGIATRQ